MGSFAGHALPGSFFIAVALWWTFQMFNRYFTCKRQNVRFISTPTYQCSCCGKRASRLPIESLVKISLAAIGGGLEIYTAMRNGKFVMIGNAQHATMFFFFGLTGVIDLLLYFKVPVPKDLDYASMFLAVFIEGLLFKFHIHGRDELDVVLHTLLIYVIGLTLLVLMAEMRWRENAMFSLLRTYCVWLQGTWFWQIGFVLYNPAADSGTWVPRDHFSIELVTMIFAWHCGFIFITMVIIGAVVFVFNRRFGKDEYQYTAIHQYAEKTETPDIVKIDGD